MNKFREKKNGRVWDITNSEHLKHFRTNPRFEEIKKVKEKKVAKLPKKEETTKE